MNGLGLPEPGLTARELRAQLAMAEACEPIEQELADAKAAYRDALGSGDQDVIASAKERKAAAANHINETRTWLRGESRIARLKDYVAQPVSENRPDTEMRLAMEQELADLEQVLAPIREALGAFPAQSVAVVVEDGSADVSLPSVTVRAKGSR